MSVWEKVFKTPKGAASLQADTLTVPDIKLPKRSYQLPSLVFGLALGSTFTKRTIFCQLGSEFLPWKPEMDNRKQDISVFRVEKVHSDTESEYSLGEESLSQFMTDRGDPSCTLFLQPNRFLLKGTNLPSFVTSYDGQKVLYQAPSCETVYQKYIKAQYEFLWNTAHKYFSEVRRFQIGSMVIETPDYFSDKDTKEYRDWFLKAAEDYFPPILSHEEDQQVELKDKFVMVPESLVTVFHWLTDHIETKLAATELELKKLMVRCGLLPRTTSSVNFLVVTMGATHSRVVRLQVDSMDHLASAKRVGETIPVFYNYLGKTGFGGDHLSCAFLEEEEEKRYGATSVHKVSTFSRKVLEDWGKLGAPEGKKHFNELCGEKYQRAIEKLGELAIKGFAENPENTIIILGGKIFDIPHLREQFSNYLNSQRVPKSRIVGCSSDEIGISRMCEIYQAHQKGLGRFFNVKSSLEAESGGRLSWRFGKVVEGSLVDTVLEPDNKAWDAENPREFTVSFERGVRRFNLGYQKSTGGISQLWANVFLKIRVQSAIQVTFITEGASDLKIKEIKTDGKVKEDDFQVDMLISGDQPSSFPLYDKLLKSS